MSHDSTVSVSTRVMWVYLSTWYQYRRALPRHVHPSDRGPENCPHCSLQYVPKYWEYIVSGDKLVFPFIYEKWPHQCVGFHRLEWPTLTFFYEVGLYSVPSYYENFRGFADLGVTKLEKEEAIPYCFQDGMVVPNVAYAFSTSRRTITDTVLARFPRITGLSLAERHSFTAEGLRQTPHVEKLNIQGCTQLTDEAFAHLSQLRSLTMERCTQLTDNAFRHCTGLVHLNMDECSQSHITDDAFRHLSSLTHLSMNLCVQRTISDRAFAYLPQLEYVSILGCNQLTEYAVEQLKNRSTAPTVVGPIIQVDVRHAFCRNESCNCGTGGLSIGQEMHTLTPDINPDVSALHEMSVSGNRNRATAPVIEEVDA